THWRLFNKDRRGDDMQTQHTNDLHHTQESFRSHQTTFTDAPYFTRMKRQEDKKKHKAGNKGGRGGAAFCSSLPFSTLEHHWWHVQPLKLTANRLAPSALSPCIIGVKGRCASQLRNQRISPLNSLKLPQSTRRK
ncbi:hypothetical protein JOQ06_021748, partial [Pogonophryne albipinna]